MPLVNCGVLKTLTAFAAVAAAAALSAGPTLTQLNAGIAGSVTIGATPDLGKSIPTFQQIASSESGGAVPILEPPGRTFPFDCLNSGLIPPLASAHCEFGSTNSKTTVLLTGDSQAEEWLAAADVAGRLLGFKVVFLAYPGCAPWGNPNPPGFVIWASTTVAKCDAWRHAVVKEARLLRPRAVILDGLAYPLGHDYAIEDRQSDFTNRLFVTVDAYRAFGMKVILLSPIPTYLRNTGGWTQNHCLEFVTPITKCEYPPSRLIDPVALAGERAATSHYHVALVDISQLMCTHTACALFVHASDGNHLVFQDVDHLNTWYSTWVGRGLAQILKSSL